MRRHHATARAGYIFFGSMVEIGNRLRATASLLGTRPLGDLIAAAGLDAAAEADLEAKAVAAAAAARRFLLLDMRAVVGIDATTATAFALLRRSLESRGVTMVITGLGSAGDGVRLRLSANGVVASDGVWESGGGCPAFESFDAALVWCEEHFMKARLARCHCACMPAATHTHACTRCGTATLHALQCVSAAVRAVRHHACSTAPAPFMHMPPGTRPVCGSHGIRSLCWPPAGGHCEWPRDGLVGADDHAG
jgi:hypothetical protein